MGYTGSTKGYVLDRKRRLEEMRKIRLSERRFNQKITDIYATSVDSSLR